MQDSDMIMKKSTVKKVPQSEDYAIQFAIAEVALTRMKSSTFFNVFALPVRPERPGRANARPGGRLWDCRLREGVEDVECRAL